MATSDALSTPERILNGARDCFAQHGFHGASMKTICATSNVSPGTLYHHFPSKEALIQAIILQDQARALAHFQAPLPAVDLVDYLVDTILSVTREDHQQRALVVEIMAEGMRNPPVAQMLESKYQTIAASLVARLADGQQKGAVAHHIDKHAVAGVMQAVTYGVIASHMHPDGEQEAALTVALRNMLHGMLCPAH